jgi:hypothetical protein
MSFFSRERLRSGTSLLRSRCLLRWMLVLVLVWCLLRGRREIVSTLFGGYTMQKFAYSQLCALQSSSGHTLISSYKIHSFFRVYSYISCKIPTHIFVLEAKSLQKFLLRTPLPEARQDAVLPNIIITPRRRILFRCVCMRI